jgi:hypothetical protein
MSIATTNNKKFLDAQGLTYFAQQLNNYPDNTVLEAVVEGIQDALDEKIDASDKGVANGVASLDSSGKIPSNQLPSGQSDVVIVQGLAELPVSGDTSKLYVVKANKQVYVWTGQAYTEASLSLGSNSTDAFRGDYGQAAYTHGVTNKGSAFSSGLYKITTNAEGHVTAATPVVKADITALGIPGSVNSASAVGTTVIADRLFLWTLDSEEIAYYTELYLKSVMSEYGDVMYDENGQPIYVDASDSSWSQDVMDENGNTLYTEDNQVLQLG